MYVDSLSDEYRKIIQFTGASEPHFPAGRVLRNGWSLWETGSPQKRDDVSTFKIAHADDISGLILACAISIMCDEPFAPPEQCQIYHNHRAKYGLSLIEA